MIRRLALILLVLAGLSLTAERAHAEDGVAVVVRELQGDEAPSARNAIVRMLLSHDNVRLVGRAHYERIAKRLGASPKDSTGLRAVIRALELGVVIEGSIESIDEGFLATVRMRGREGDVLESHKFSAKTRGELARELGENGWKALGPAITDAETLMGRSKPKQRRVVFLELAGPKSTNVRAAIEGALSKLEGWELIAEEEALVARPDEAGKPAERVAVAEALGATALLRGEVSGGRANQLRLSVINAKNGDDIGEVKLKGVNTAGLERAIGRGLGNQLLPLLERTERRRFSPEELEDEAPEEAAPKSESSGPRPSPLEATLGLRAGTRNFRYADDRFGALRAYKMGLTPAAFVAARWYPAAHFEKGAVAHVGISAAYEQAFLIKSQVNGESYDTTAREWMLGVRGRLPLDDLELGAELDLGEHSFNVDDDPNLPFVPDVAYRFIRLGVDARYRSGSISVGGNFAYRHVTDSGAIATDAWFPRLDVAGLDTGLYAGYSIGSDFELLAGVLYRRYWFKMNPEPGDRFVAGGALDSYISGFLGVGYRLAQH